jgi:hypothetical protein
MRDSEVRSQGVGPRGGGRAARRRTRLAGLIALGVLGGGTAVGLATVSSLTRPVAPPPVRQAVLTAATTGCDAAPPAVLLASAFSRTLVTPTPTPTPTPTVTPPPIDPGPPATVAPTPTPTPNTTTTPTKPASTTPPPIEPGPPATRVTAPSKSPTPTPSKTSTPPASPSPSTSASRPPTKTRKPAPVTPQLCVSVQPFSSQVQPGQTASYAISVWSTGRSSKAAVVQIRAARATDVSGPKYTVCPSISRTGCSVGGLSTSQSDQLEADINVGSQAPGGDGVELTATVSAAGALSASASAVVDVITPTAGDPSGLLSDTALELGSAGGDFPPLLDLPGVTPVNPTTLFPTVSPGSGSGGAGSGQPGARPGHIDAVNTAAVVPRSALSIGGQIAGLAVLAGAIALAFVRFSLRRPRTTDGPAKPE